MRRGITSLMAIVVVAGCTRADTPAAAGAGSGRIEVGALAPAYSATTMKGDSVSLAGLRGKVVLLNVWATWCGPCRKEIPELRALNATYRDRGLELVGVTVDSDGTDDAIRAFLTEFRMDYAIWHDPNESVQTLFRMSGVPATFLIDRKGVIRWKTTGAVAPHDSTLAAAIEKAISGD